MKEFKGTQGDWAVSQDHPLSGKSGYEHYRILKSGKGFLDIDLQGFGLAGFINDRDANLIAAAPELLEALLNIIGAFDNPIARRKLPSEFNSEAINSARKAIDKALGELK